VGSWWWDLLLWLAARLLLGVADADRSAGDRASVWRLLGESSRLLPDLLRLLPRPSADRSLPRRGARG